MVKKKKIREEESWKDINIKLDSKAIEKLRKSNLTIGDLKKRTGAT